MTECDFYDLVLSIISQRLLWILAIVVALGWLWRLRYNIPYAPPKAAKITAAGVFGALAYFYLMADFADWPLEHYQALSRVVFLMLLLHEIMHHIFVAWVCRRKNGKAISG